MCAHVRLDEAASEGEGDRLGAGIDAELREDVLDVGGDGLRADHEIRGDLTLRPPLGEEAEDLASVSRSLGEALKQAASVMKRRGLVIVVSDLYEEAEALPQVRDGKLAGSICTHTSSTFAVVQPISSKDSSGTSVHSCPTSHASGQL